MTPEAQPYQAEGPVSGPTVVLAGQGCCSLASLGSCEPQACGYEAPAPSLPRDPSQGRARRVGHVPLSPSSSRSSCAPGLAQMALPWPVAQASGKGSQHLAPVLCPARAPASPHSLGGLGARGVAERGGCPTPVALPALRGIRSPSESTAALTLAFPCSLPVSGLRAGGRGWNCAFWATSRQRCVSGPPLGAALWFLQPRLKESSVGLGFSVSGAYNSFFLAPEVAEQKLMTEKVPGPSPPLPVAPCPAPWCPRPPSREPEVGGGGERMGPASGLSRVKASPPTQPPRPEPSSAGASRRVTGVSSEPGLQLRAVLTRPHS